MKRYEVWLIDKDTGREKQGKYFSRYDSALEFAKQNVDLLETWCAFIEISYVEKKNVCILDKKGIYEYGK